MGEAPEQSLAARVEKLERVLAILIRVMVNRTRGCTLFLSPEERALVEAERDRWGQVD